ncbi:MAG: potassium transporter TrkG [Sphingorhabdus sp.]|uniref:TrkH family potassium uptake protein n=1 Tax=Sphingorhabdus sp. TaxID=1902408 RepID=UPI003C920B95
MAEQQHHPEHLVERLAVGTLDRLVNLLFARPVQIVPVLFFFVSLLGALALSFPAATESGQGTPFVDAWFTAVSALCVTGLSTLDVPNHWSGMGELTILILIQLGGLGIMSASVLIVALFSRTMGFGIRRGLAAENSGITPGNVRPLLRIIVVFTITFEAAVAAWLCLWLWLGHGQALGEAGWNGLFHAVSSFNNAGFALWSDNLMGFRSDWLFLTPIMAAVVAGGIGYPVYRDMWTQRGWKRISLHGRLTLLGYAFLLIAGAVLFILLEWDNPETMGTLEPHAHVLNGLFQSVTSRTAGFNAVNIGGLTDQSLMLTSILMFIGGGSAGTAGGVKVATIVVILLIIWSEIRGKPDVEAFGRRIGEHNQRRAISVVALAALLVMSMGYLLVALSPHIAARDAMFEAVSAFTTTGLSTGVTAQFTDPGKYLLIFLMLVGRVGPITLFAALASRGKPVFYHYPKEEVLIG